MADTIVTLSGDDAKLLAAFLRVKAEQEKQDKGWDKNRESSKKSTDSQVEDLKRRERDEKRAADNIYREHQKLLDAKDLESRKAGQKQAAIARQVAIAEAKEAARAADTVIRELDKIAAEKKKLAMKDESQDSFGLGLKSTISLVGAATTALALATKAWGQYKEARDKAVETIGSVADENQRLVQVAENPEDLKQLQLKADASAMQSGQSREVARRVLFSARSENFESSFPAIMEAGQVVSPESAVTVAGKLPAMFKGKILPAEAISMTLAAAKASNLNFEQISTSLPSAAEGGAIAGASPSELLGSLSVLSSRFKSGDVAADRIKSFGASLGIKEEFKGLGIVKSVEKISAMDDESRKKVLGESQELNVAYTVLKEELPAIKERTAMLEKDQADFQKGGGMLRQQMKIANSDPVMAKSKKMKQAKITAEVERERNLGEAGLESEIVVENSSAILERKKAGLVNRLATNAASGFMSMFGADQSGIGSNAFGDVIDSAFWGKAPNPTKTIRAASGIMRDQAEQEQATQQSMAGNVNIDGVVTELQKTNALLEKQNAEVEAQTKAIKAPDGSTMFNYDSNAIRAQVTQNPPAKVIRAQLESENSN